MRLTEEKRQALHKRLAEIEAEMAGMTVQQKRDYLVATGAAREMTEAEVKEYYGGYGVTTITFIGELRLQIRRGDMVRVQVADGSWHNRMVAVGLEGASITVAEEGEWLAAQAEQREPVTSVYPAEQVERVSEE